MPTGSLDLAGPVVFGGEYCQTNWCAISSQFPLYDDFDALNERVMVESPSDLRITAVNSHNPSAYFPTNTSVTCRQLDSFRVA